MVGTLLSFGNVNNNVGLVHSALLSKNVLFLIGFWASKTKATYQPIVSYVPFVITDFDVAQIRHDSKVITKKIKRQQTTENVSS